MDDLNLELDRIEEDSEGKLQVKNRFQQLSDKVKTEAQEKEKALAEAKAAAERVASLEKEVQFAKSFNQISAKYPEAHNYQDQILAKVNAGYEPEDAALAVLHKEGKLGQIETPVLERPHIEGGSAISPIPGEDKLVSDLSATEKLSELEKLEKSGELAQVFKSGISRG